jgi:RNA recognition motif-containing protein
LSLAFVIVHQFCFALFVKPYHAFLKHLIILITENMNIYVSNLSFDVQDQDLREFFTPYGEVTSAKIINDRESGRSRGFGFVEMSDDEAAKKAIAELNDSSVDGRNIKVMEARPKEDRPAKNFGGGGGGGYRNSNPFKNKW